MVTKTNTPPTGEKVDANASEAALAAEAKKLKADEAAAKVLITAAAAKAEAAAEAKVHVQSEVRAEAMPLASKQAKSGLQFKASEHVNISVVTLQGTLIQFTDTYTCQDEDEELALLALASRRPDMLTEV